MFEVLTVVVMIAEFPGAMMVAVAAVAAVAANMS